jgi:hypothetical protein
METNAFLKILIKKVIGYFKIFKTILTFWKMNGFIKMKVTNQSLMYMEN